jgi:5'-3' exonuclease
VAESKPRVFLIDASIYIFRAWYSVPDDLVNSAGNPINALHGFAGFLAGFLEQVKPEHLAVVFDESLTSSFRNDIYPDYKANREPPPPELKQQFDYCRTLVQTLGLAAFSSQTYEADDLIGTLAATMRARGFAIVVMSADKDLAQLLEAGDMLWDYARQRRHQHQDVRAWLGVEPQQVADWLALAGDAVDNIPGVPGIGPKTAAALLSEFGTLKEIYRRIEAVADLKIRGAARVQRLLQEHETAALLARELTAVAIDPDMNVTESDIGRGDVSAESITAVCEQLGLGRMTAARLTRAIG